MERFKSLFKPINITEMFIGYVVMKDKCKFHN